MVCDIDANFDIKQEFELISQIQPDSEKHFKKLLLYYASFTELPESAFADITFDEISIRETQNLTFINTKAFIGPTANVTKILTLSQRNQLRNNPPNYDLYAAFSSLTNLESIDICLESYTSHEIPEKAFRQIYGPQNNLKEINFRGDYNISNINDNAFYELTNLSAWIHFGFLPVGYISSGAFDFESPSEETLQIHLQNCFLTEYSFGNNVFSGSQRPLNIDLSKLAKSF